MNASSEDKALRTLQVLNEKATALYRLCRPERIRLPFSDERAEVVMQTDGASAFCAGYVPQKAEDFRGTPDEAVRELGGISLLDRDEVVAWLAEHGESHPLISAWVYAVEVLRMRLIDYYRHRLSQGTAGAVR